MRKILIGIMICTFVFIFFSANAKAQDPIVGTWETFYDQGPNKGKPSSLVKMFEKDGLYFGTIVKILDGSQDQVCDKCKGDLKNKPVLGITIVNNMKKTGNEDKKLGWVYEEGTVLDPDNGENYKGIMWVKDDVLTARGYIGISLFGRNVKWHRVK